MGIQRIFSRTNGAPKALEAKSFSTSTLPDGFPSVEIMSDPTDHGKESTFGTNAVVKTFYQDCKKGWVETPPKQLSSKASKVYDRVAIKVYKAPDPTKPVIAGRAPMMNQTIEVQSPILVSVLKTVLEPLGTFLEAKETARFQAPFKPLYFAYDKIMALYQRASDDTILKEHLHLLTQLMIEVLGSMRARVRNLGESKLISYDVAWAYFPKGSTIYCGSEDCERLFRVLDTQYDCEKSLLLVSCQDIAFDGSKYEWRPANLKIPGFRGNVPVSSLPNYPLSFHSNAEILKDRLTARAKVVFDYQELKYREYSGTGKSDDPCINRHNVSGRILVDFHGYEKHCKGLQRQSGDSEGKSSSYIKPLSRKLQDKNKASMLARKGDMIFVSPMLSGFALKDKLWLRFYVDDIGPVTWNDEAYEHLVYPKEQKDLVLTFVENHQKMKAGLTDVIMGKGQGLVTLLSGPPGTGKTLLAEAVADKTRRPLYYLQAEELGTNATSLGKNIKKVFEMATEWNAVILLDEADVFMAERSPSDVLRNELVSIFLRELEYFQGIIFLTTNLLATIDNAFRSRVNIHLIFSPLSISSRIRLWQKLLSRLPQPEEGQKSLVSNFSAADLEQLGAWELNGREIKNAIKTVRTWCVCKGYQMSLQRLESGIAVTAPQAQKAEVSVSM